MGRCGGLKEGGHHRKAIDVAKKKKAEKAEKAARKEAAGQRAASLEKLLAIDPDCDIYLAAAADTDVAGDTKSMCRSYFRHDRCTNRRCKFSHDYSIVDALVPGSGKAEEEEGAPSMPPVELVPGLVGARPYSGVRDRRLRRAVPPPVPGAAGSFEEMPISTIQTIVAYCQANADVGNAVRSCRYLRQCLLDCRNVRARKRAAMEVRLQSRNGMLLVRATAERLRFAVSYANVAADTNTTYNTRVKGRTYNGKGGGGKKGKGSMARPTLAYDFENPHIFRDFQANFRREIESECRGLSSALAVNCHVQEP